jgi:signal transduction histidine kinase
MPEVYATDLPVQPRQLISNLRDLAVQTLDEVRKLALELRPSVLDDLGLVAALRQYVRSVEERSGISTQLTAVGWDTDDQRLPAEVETALFRIAQEALTNAIRHAQAATVQIRLRRSPGRVSLDVRDDGVGLSALPASEEGQHLGMFGMRERARLLRGEFVVTPVSPHGTLIHVIIPL